MFDVCFFNKLKGAFIGGTSFFAYSVLLPQKDDHDPYEVGRDHSKIAEGPTREY